MAVDGNELATLDFSNLIGGPLNAVIESQAKSAIATANFIKDVGFDKDGKVINMDFNYTKANADGRQQGFKLSVPLITMLPIPYLKIDEATVEFNAKLTSQTSETSDTTTTTSGGSKVSMWFGSARMSAKTSYQSKTASSDSEERSFDMNIKVTATGAEMPEGTARVLSMLEESLKESPKKIQPIVARIIEVDATNKKILTIDTALFDQLTPTMSIIYGVAGTPADVSTAVVTAIAIDTTVNEIMLTIGDAESGDYNITVAGIASESPGRYEKETGRFIFDEAQTTTVAIAAADAVTLASLSEFTPTTDTIKAIDAGKKTIELTSNNIDDIEDIEFKSLHID